MPNNETKRAPSKYGSLEYAGEAIAAIRALVGALPNGSAFTEAELEKTTRAERNGMTPRQFAEAVVRDRAIAAKPRPKFEDQVRDIKQTLTLLMQGREVAP